MKSEFQPTSSLEMLQTRSQMMKRVRDFFDTRHFLEVETPILSHDICVDRYIQPISVLVEEVLGYKPADSNEDARLWLQSSPEFGMKRLLAAGAVAIYQLTKAFRAGERGKLHNPEFTMLEWYRAGDDMHSGMDFLGEFVSEILELPPAQRTTYQQAFQNHAGVDVFAASSRDLEEVCRSLDLVAEDSDHVSSGRDCWLNLLLSQIIEPKLGQQCPEIIYDWPASQSALAIVRHDENEVAERFELYVNGMEVANGYHELLDPEELYARNSINNQLRVKDGKRLLPEDSRLISAMKHGIPACAGVALGMDRLIMLATGAQSIEEVLTFPIETA